MKAFFLYTELADYTMLCFKKHLALNPEDEIHVVHFPVNEEAPFQFEETERLHLYNKAAFEIPELWELFRRVDPNVVLCSGWSDRMYNKFVKSASKQVPVILCFDNYFRYTLKQFIGVPVARTLFKNVYSGVWVPGEKQKEYARLLGFPDHTIHTCFYSTDIGKYEDYFRNYVAEKTVEFPKKFLCVARYIPQKGLKFLWEAFIEICSEDPACEWELWCAGSGEGYPERMQHPKIKHLGFVQPEQFDHLVRNCGVFVLPSLFEPWGVVVHEFAAAGFPLALSKKVGSGHSLLNVGVNGFHFRPGKKESIKRALRKFMNLSSEALLEMGRESSRLAGSCNAEKWSATLSKLAALRITGKNKVDG